jgi:hypothetical protein
MSLRIAVDLDGTLADMDTALQEEAERLFGPGVDLRASLRGRVEGTASVESPDPTGTTPDVRTPLTTSTSGTRLSDRQQRQLWSRVRATENFWLSLREIEPGAVAKLAHAAASNGWDILFITTRPSSAGDTTQIQSQRWLEARGFELPSVFVVSGSRGHIATALTLDAVLDDRPENCLDVATDSKAAPVLVWRDSRDTAPPGAKRLGIHVVCSIAEALELLETRSPAASRPNMISRLRTILGI